MLYYDGGRLRMVAWQDRRGLLLGLQHAAQLLTDRQMLGIAEIDASYARLATA